MAARKRGLEGYEEYLKNWGSNPSGLRSPFSIDGLPNYRVALALLAVGTPNDLLCFFLGNHIFSTNVLSFRKKKALIKAMRKIKRRADEYLSLLDS